MEMKLISEVPGPGMKATASRLYQPSALTASQ